MILFKQILPMLESGSCVTWIGTLIDRKSFLYRAVLGDDERFNNWNRKVYKAITYDKEDKTKFQLLWPSKWPKEILDARKDEIGSAAFHSEYLNEPISAQDRILFVDEKKNEYSVEGDFDWTQPLSNENKVKWHERVFGDDNDKHCYEEHEKSFAELVRPMFKILLFDYAQGLTSNHDYSCIHILGFDRQATMWVLHSWLGRAKKDTLLRLIYEKGYIWDVKILGIEAVSIQRDFAEAAAEYTSERQTKSGDRWRPRVFPIVYPQKDSKQLRIASLEWRFNSGRVKYPSHLKEVWPYNQLYAQTADFTMDLALLQYDDAIDTLAMSKYVIKTKGGKFKREPGKPDLLERIKKDQPVVKGMPLLSGISSENISDEMTNILSEKARKKGLAPKPRRIERKNLRIKR